MTILVCSGQSYVEFSAAERGSAPMLLAEAEGLGAGVGFVFGEAADDALLG